MILWSHDLIVCCSVASTHLYQCTCQLLPFSFAVLLGPVFTLMQNNSAGEWKWWFRVCLSVSGTQGSSFVSHLAVDWSSFNCKMITVMSRVQNFKGVSAPWNTKAVSKLPWQCKSLKSLEVNSGEDRILPILMTTKQMYQPSSFIPPLYHRCTSLNWWQIVSFHPSFTKVMAPS